MNQIIKADFIYFHHNLDSYMHGGAHGGLKFTPDTYTATADRVQQKRVILIFFNQICKFSHFVSISYKHYEVIRMLVAPASKPKSWLAQAQNAAN